MAATRQKLLNVATKWWRGIDESRTMGQEVYVLEGRESTPPAAPVQRASPVHPIFDLTI